MKTAIVKGLTDKDAEIVSRQFEESISLRCQLVKLLEEKIRSEQSVTISKDGYESPSWAYRQADSNGYKRGLFEIISLLSEKVVEKS